MRTARKPIFVTLFILVVLFLMLPAIASAAEFDVSVQTDPARVKAVGDQVSITILVENVSCDTEDPISLCDVSGEVIPGFGEDGYALLSIGKSTNVSFTHQVTEEELGAGQIAFVLRYTKVSDNEVQHYEQKITAPVIFDGTLVSLNAERAISPEVARKGSTVNVVYELYNNGTEEITDIKVQETVVKTAQTVKSLKPGQKTTLTFSPRMGSESLSSSALIQYKANGEAGEITVPALEIPLATPNLTMIVSGSEEGVNIGENADLTVTFDNKGNIRYYDVTVSDEKAGTLLTGIEIPANRTVSFNVPVLMTEPVTFHLKADLKDNTGSTASISADEHSVNAYDPEKSIRLSLTLTSDEDTVTELPATLAFRLVLTNDSNVTAKGIRITHRDQNIVSNLTLEPGQSQTLIRNVRISSVGSFRFTASCQDGIGNNVSFDSNTLKITKVTLSSTPSPTEIPLPVQPTEVPAEDTLTRLSGIRDILFKALNIVAYAAIAVAALLLIALLVRGIRSASRKKAYDHMDLADRRDYREASSGEKHRREVEPSVMTETEKRSPSQEEDVDLNDESLTVGAAPRRDKDLLSRVHSSEIENRNARKAEEKPAQAQKAEPSKKESSAASEKNAAKPLITTRPFPGAEKQERNGDVVPQLKAARPRLDDNDSPASGGRHAVTGNTDTDDGE